MPELIKGEFIVGGGHGNLAFFFIAVISAVRCPVFSSRIVPGFAEPGSVAAVPAAEAPQLDSLGRRADFVTCRQPKQGY